MPRVSAHWGEERLMHQVTKINFVLAREKDTEVGDKMLNLWNGIEELYREARINRKLLKVKTKQLKKLEKDYPEIHLCTDYMEHDDYYGY
jgi:uncharacterized membrane-anchored protein YjiN (DUF445 family)